MYFFKTNKKQTLKEGLMLQVEQEEEVGPSGSEKSEDSVGNVHQSIASQLKQMQVGEHPEQQSNIIKFTKYILWTRLS